MSFVSLESFYSENEARRKSPEADYGGSWLDGLERNTVWRVSYIQATGEVYALEVESGWLKVLAVVPPDPGPAFPLARHLPHKYYKTLDRLLEGWALRCGQPGGLQWLRARLWAYEPPLPAVHGGGK